MEKRAGNPTAKFLQKAAQEYAETVPPLAAEMMVNRALHTRPAVPVKNEACQGCGTVQILGSTARQLDGSVPDLIRRAQRRRHSERKVISGGTEPPRKSVMIECIACRRFRKLEQTETEREMSHQLLGKKTSTDPTRSEPHTDTGHQDSKSANRISKERSKARKNSTLQAMLDRTKRLSSNKDSGGLDLMDLMKDG